MWRRLGQYWTNIWAMLFYSQKIFSLCLNVWVLTADCWQIYFNYHERVEILLLLDARKVRLMQWRSGEGGIVVQNWREGVCKREYSVFEGGKGTKVQRRECIGRWVLLLQVLSAEPAIWFYTAFIIWIKFFFFTKSSLISASYFRSMLFWFQQRILWELYVWYCM